VDPESTQNGLMQPIQNDFVHHSHELEASGGERTSGDSRRRLFPLPPLVTTDSPAAVLGRIARSEVMQDTFRRATMASRLLRSGA
jgi:hypothetical protein